MTSSYLPVMDLWCDVLRVRSRRVSDLLYLWDMIFEVGENMKFIDFLYFHELYQVVSPRYKELSAYYCAHLLRGTITTYHTIKSGLAIFFLTFIWLIKYRFSLIFPKNLKSAKSDQNLQNHITFCFKMLRIICFTLIWLSWICFTRMRYQNWARRIFSMWKSFKKFFFSLRNFFFTLKTS